MKKIQRQTGRFAALLLAAVLFLTPCLSLQTYAAAGRMVLGLSADSVAVGDKITVYISAKDAGGASVTADMKITFNTSVFEYVSSNAGSAQNSGDTITVNGSSISVTFKAIAAGECRVIANGTSSAGELTAGGVRIPATEAEGQTEEPKTEEPENNNTEEPADEEEEPENGAVKSDVKPAFQIDGVIYEVSGDFDNELVNKGFEPVELTVQEATVRGLQYPDSEWTVLFLVEEGNDANNGYYLYDQKTGNICPYLSYRTVSQGSERKGDDGVSEAEYARLKERYDSLKQGNRKMMLGMIIGVIILALIIVNIFIFRGINRREEPEDDYDEEFEDDGYDEKKAIEKQGEYLKAKVKAEQVKEEAVKEKETEIEEDDGDSLEFIDFKDL